MNKYATGSYLIKLFDRVGGKIATRKTESQSLIGAQHEGISAVNNGEAASFVILRVMDNSALRTRENWD
jgi:hypothetical protein